MRGERWRATATTPLAPGQRVRILERRKLTLSVEPGVGSEVLKLGLISTRSEGEMNFSRPPMRPTAVDIARPRSRPSARTSAPDGPSTNSRLTTSGRHLLPCAGTNQGAVAQLVAHLHGMEGVRGSNPLSSTKGDDT